MSPRNPSFTKREREQAQKERTRAREQKKVDRRSKKAEPGREGGEDPDIAGIVPGPQPPTEE
jgi:hypothetical protein